MAEEAVSLVISRPMLSELAQTLSDFVSAGVAEINSSVEQQQRKTAVAEVSEHLLELLQPRLVSFEEQVSVIRLTLASIYELEEEWSKAARTLMGIPLDTGPRCDPLCLSGLLRLVASGSW